jgi:glycosyltransferase involved in cell wall biosynthesis
MRLLALTAGAAEMYCGSCLRDNALAAELLARGHDVTLLPVYTPTVTDEPNVSADRVFLGGISVYLEQKVPLFRKTPWIVDRLWDSPGVIKALAGRASGGVDPHGLGELTVSMLEGEDGFQAKEIRKLVHWLQAQPPYDLITLPNSLLVGLAPALARASGTPIACTLQGEDLFLEGTPEPHRTRARDLIRKHAPAVDGFVAVSGYYKHFMSEYLGLPPGRVHVAPLGINVQDFEGPRPERQGPFTLGFFARVAPEKGLHLLADAYRVLRQERGLPPSRLVAAGYLAPEHRGYLAGIEERLREWGLLAEFRYEGALDRQAKARFLRGLDVLSVPSPYAEPKGLYLLEALACGVPVVQPRHGAFPEVLEKAGGGVLFPPGDVGALADALHTLASDPAAARALGAAGAAGVRRHYDVAHMAERVLEVYETVISPRPLHVATART